MLVLPGMDGNDTETCSFGADTHAVSLAVATARRFGERAALPTDMRAKLAIIVEELVTNIVEHGDAAGRPITLELAAALHEVRLTLTDEGTFFDPRGFKAPEFTARGGGAGIALVLAWARITGYRRIGSRNQLELTLRNMG